MDDASEPRWQMRRTTEVEAVKAEAYREAEAGVAVAELEESAAAPEGPPQAEEPRPIPVVQATATQRELVPVPASVFDDDFFTKPNEELRARELGETAARPNRISLSAAPESKATHWQEPAKPAHTAAEAVHEPDELDIPAFLRRTR